MRLKVKALELIFLMNLKHRWREYAVALTHGWKLAITIAGIFFADSPMLYFMYNAGNEIIASGVMNLRMDPEKQKQRIEWM